MARGTPSAVVKQAKERWTRCAEAEEAQRKAILAAKEFRAGNQWPDEVKLQRQGASSVQGQAAQPPRPCLTIDRLSQPIRQVSNTIRGANFGLDVLPNGHGADDETAKIFKGYIRRVQNQARDEAPIEWAADQAIEGGIGWFALKTEWVHPEPTTTQQTQSPQQLADRGYFDQELKLFRITNNLSVYDDPSAVKPTRSDSMYRFITNDIPKEIFKQRWPKADLASLDDFASTGDNGKWDDWVQKGTIRVAEYWRVVLEDGPTYCLMADGSIVQKTKDTPEDQIQTERKTEIRRVKMSVINAVEELETHEWVGSYLPQIPILGEELNLDGRIKLRGLIEEGMDSQRMVNYTYSGAIETVALASKAPWIVEEGQIATYKDIWQNANRYNYAFLPYKAVSLLGHPIGPPVRDSSEPPIQAMVLMLQKSEEAIKATTGIYDPGLGNTNPREKSGRAILALQNQSELGQSNYVDNVSRALVYLGELMLEIIPKITREGQILQILGIDDQPEQVMVGQPFTRGPDGQVRPAQIPPEQVKLRKGMEKFYDLNNGRYAVTVSVGKDYPTARAEGAQMLGDLIEKNPQLLSVFGDIFFRDLNFPGAQEVAERMKKGVIDPKLLQGEGGEEGPSPEQLQAELQKLSQLFQMATKELQAKTQIIETEQVKAQQELQKEQIKAKAAEQEKLIDADARIQIATIQANAMIGAAEIKAGMEQMQAQIDQITELFTTMTGIGHEAGMQAREHAHERDLADQQQAHEQDLAQQQADATESQMVTQAVLQPKESAE